MLRSSRSGNAAATRMPCQYVLPTAVDPTRLVARRRVWLGAGVSPESPRAGLVPWARRWRRVYTVVVFIILASLDNVAIGLVPPLFRPIGQSLGVPEAAVGLVTAVSYLVSALAAVGWAYVGDRANRKS